MNMRIHFGGGDKAQTIPDKNSFDNLSNTRLEVNVFMHFNSADAQLFRHLSSKLISDKATIKTSTASVISKRSTKKKRGPVRSSVG